MFPQMAEVREDHHGEESFVQETSKLVSCVSSAKTEKGLTTENHTPSPHHTSPPPPPHRNEVVKQNRVGQIVHENVVVCWQMTQRMKMIRQGLGFGLGLGLY